MTRKTVVNCLFGIALAFSAGTAESDAVALSPDGFPKFDEAQIEAGWQLFYDPLLSGNRNISCATCHHPKFATSDGLSLGFGEGGIGLGPERRADPSNLPEQRIPRNSPALFNMGHRDVTVMFHDGRIEVDRTRPSGLRTPLEEEMVGGFASLLSAQTMFPVLSADEMAGHYQENDVSKAVRQGRITGEGGAWDIIAKRVDALPEYRAQFSKFDPAIAAGRQISFTDVSDAIAAFVSFEWRADETVYDIALRGGAPLTGAAQRGQERFFGVAGCSACHSGPLLSDQSFHAMAMPQLGPGKSARFESNQRDDGRFRVTGNLKDAFAFRTPMLRNVVHTGPWGHAGSHSDLADFLLYHADPVSGIEAYSRQTNLSELKGASPDWAIMDSPEEKSAIKAAYRQEPKPLDDAALSDILAFLATLSDEVSLKGRLGIPEKVPSGLPIDR